VTLTKTFTGGLLIFFLISCNGFLLLLIVNEKINVSIAQPSLNSTSASTNPKNILIKAGQGNTTISYNTYYPSSIEIVKGDSITWYSGMDMPLPHTVTFTQGLDSIEKIATPFYVPNTTNFVPEVENIGQPLNKTFKNGTEIVNEKFVNSGPLLSLDEKQNFDYSFSNYFTLVFDKPGLYEYHCLFHPWMVGKVLVKPK
jgi:plastocyanin